MPSFRVIGKAEVRVSEMFRLRVVAETIEFTPIPSLVKHLFSLFSFLPENNHERLQAQSTPSSFLPNKPNSNNINMCFGKRSSAPTYSSSSSSSDEYNARPVELSTLRRSLGDTGRFTASMPQAAQRTTARETIRIVEEISIACDDQHNQCELYHLSVEETGLMISCSEEVDACRTLPVAFA